MVEYGYTVGDIIDSPKLIVPDKLHKIHLTPTRSKFIISGTKHSIFNWMKSHEHVICEFDQESQFISHPKLIQKFTTGNQYKISLNEPNYTLTFELYEEDEHDKIFKRMFSSSKMKLEIKGNCKNKSSSKYMRASSVMSINGRNGISLHEALMAFKNNPSRRKYYNLSSEQRARVTCDYE
ncbi:hypothetical protein RclHR1_05570007 [Rhizophagus clarus]|uniref:Uncharacterized protein n=1 Tax=Rhizophagus clarus TaxID=94130 RepID=A0A2Z6RN13_9GLOM|nr:hypothetical protein RclHR1_05570007 [Rhizophagus clarus]GES78910.1 hypothetical protein GLOIN_2v1768850 [Rhizophagus clarus]